MLEVVKAIRREVGDDFHLQMKISAVDEKSALFFGGQQGNTLEESMQVCQWLEEAGVDALHVSVGSFFPHPMEPQGGTRRSSSSGCTTGCNRAACAAS